MSQPKAPSRAVSDKDKSDKNFKEKIADNIADAIASESLIGHENNGRVSWLGFVFIILVMAYFFTSDVLEIRLEILITVALIYLYQCIVIVVSAVSRIAQKTASILGVVAMFTVSYEESGLNVMKAFFDGISKAAESDQDSQAKTEVKNR